MKKPLASLILLVYPLLLLSCAANDSRYYPVINRAPRQNSQGFTITPPPGHGWYERHKGDSLFYLKQTSLNNYAIYTKATEIHIDPGVFQKQGFVSFVRRQKRLPQEGSRYRKCSLTIRPEKTLSPYCARYRRTYEDHGENAATTGATAADAYVMVEDGGLLCMCPDKPGVGVDMYYEERSRVGANFSSYRDEGQVFLHSLKFQQQP